MTDRQREFDVVIVGSGAGGAAAAWALSNKGARVLVLEAGPPYDPFKDYRLDKANWEDPAGFPHKPSSEGRYTFGELQLLWPRWDTLRSWNHLSGRLNKGNRRRGWKYHHVRGVGGSTLHFTGEAHRINPRAMRMRTEFGVAADWPIGYSDLETYYEIAERIVGVAGSPLDRSRPRRSAFPLPPHSPSYASRAIIERTRRLGVNWVANSLAALSEPYDDRPPCNYCGGCNLGCPRTDKGSTDVTFLRKALATGRCVIRSNSTVVSLQLTARDRIGSLDYVDANGVIVRQETPRLILACGAIETPRLLLQTRGPYAPDGLGNESGQVGQNFMETVFFASSGLQPTNLGSHRGLPSDIICWDHNAPDAVPGTIGGCRFTPQLAEARLNGPLAHARRVVGGWGLAHRRRMRETFGRLLTVGSIGESLPNSGSFIDLDPNVTDSNGLPVARIYSRLEEPDLKRLDFMAQRCREILEACGVTERIEEYGSYDFFSSTHVFGTCRMGTDPSQSVVDAECRSHRWRNLSIVDASVFPSSGGGESPSLTIEALAIRASDRMTG
jgi:choline dehydrogenase-like flavoprotein